MPQIYQGRSAGQTIGEAIGTGAAELGAGVAQGMEQLTQAKMRELLRRQEQGRREEAWKKILPPEQQQYASALAGLPDAITSPFGKEIAAGPRHAREAMAYENAANLGQQQPTPREQLLGTQQTVPQSDVAPYADMLNAPELTGQPQTQINIPQKPFKLPGGISPQASKGAIDILMKNRAMAQKEHQFNVKNQNEIRKQNDAFVEKINTEAESAKRVNEQLNIIENFDKQNKLNSPYVASAVQFLKDKVGLDLSGYLTPESQFTNASKVAAFENMRQVFGGRVTQQEAMVFLDKWPTLINSKEGRQILGTWYKELGKAKLASKEALDEVLKKNKNVWPNDIKDQVIALADKKKDQIYADMKNKIFKEAEAFGSTDKIKYGNSNYKVISRVDEKPKAADYKGKYFRDPSSGKLFESDGINWKEVSKNAI
jgi:hypothetical protein